MRTLLFPPLLLCPCQRAVVDPNAAIARAIATEERLPVDDLHGLVAGNPGVHGDPCHCNGRGSGLQAAQGAAQVLAALDVR